MPDDMTVPAAAWTFRPLRPDETGLLERATLANMNWCGERFTLADVRSRPEFVHYTRLETERGDFGIVAEWGGRGAAARNAGAGAARPDAEARASAHDAGAAGVVWLQFLPMNDAGYGFVAEGVPELSLCVVDGTLRGHGLGTALLAAAIGEARLRGIGRVSLSVEDGNFARDLYLRHGFRPTETPGTLLWRLDQGGLGG